MATIKKRMRSRKHMGMSEGERIYLLYGFDFLCDLRRDDNEAFMKDEKRQRALWARYGKKLFEEWIQSKGYACERPAAWWKFDAPGKRLIIERRPYKNTKGEPEPREMWPDGHIETHYDIIEPQGDALERLGLLEPFEVEFLERLRGLNVKYR